MLMVDNNSRSDRTREHLTADEVERLIEAAKCNRYGSRDALAILLAYRHELRAAEVIDLRREQIDFKAATLCANTNVRRLRVHSPLTSVGFSRMVERAGARDQGSRPHAETCLRLRSRERGRRYQGAPG
jgi:integrase